jgi:hypothetical protein
MWSLFPCAQVLWSSTYTFFHPTSPSGMEELAFDLPQKLRINKLKALLKWRTSRFCNTHMWQWLISFVFCFPLNWLARGLSNVILWHLFLFSHSDVFSSLFKREWLNIKDRAFVAFFFRWSRGTSSEAFIPCIKPFLLLYLEIGPCQKVHPLWFPTHHNIVILFNLGACQKVCLSC